MSSFQFHCPSVKVRNAVLEEAKERGWYVPSPCYWRDDFLWLIVTPTRVNGRSHSHSSAMLIVPLYKGINRVLAGPPKPAWHWPSPTENDIGKPVFVKGECGNTCFAPWDVLLAIRDGYYWVMDEGEIRAHRFPFCVLPDPNNPTKQPPKGLKWPRPPAAEAAEAEGGSQ